MTRLFGDGRSGYRRMRGDWYVEPERAVVQLLERERFEGRIHDPACGCGTIPRVCRTWGYRASGSDIADRGFGRAGVDFLTARLRPVDNIVCNPPYSLAEAFVLRALECARRKVAMLLRLAFLEGGERFRDLFDRTPPARIWVFTWRVPMPPGVLKGRLKEKGGAIAYCWMVWERGFSGAPSLGWL